MLSAAGLHVTITSSPASDSWGFVGVLSVGDFEAYRTIRAYSTPDDALQAGQHLLAEVLGTLMAGQEWRTAEGEFGHAPRRTDLQFGLRANRGAATAAAPAARVEDERAST